MVRAAGRVFLFVAVLLAVVAIARAVGAQGSESPRIASVTMSPNRVDGGAPPVTGTVTLDRAATTNVNVQLKSSNAQAATVPGSVTVKKGEKQATFTVTIGQPPATTNVSITALVAGSVRPGNLVVQVAAAPKVQRIGLNPATVAGGGTVLAVIYLNGSAPAGGQAVALSYSPGSVISGPSSVTVPERASATEVQLKAASPDRQATAQLKASIAGAGPTATITVKGSAPVVPTRASIVPGRLRSGDAATLTVEISDLAPAGGLVLTLSSNAPQSLTLPATATVPAGSRNTRVGFSAKTVEKGGTAQVTASASGTSVRAPVDLIR